MTTGKTIDLTIQTFVGKLMCLLFNTLSRFATAFFQELYFNMMAVVTVQSGFGTQENKICPCFHLTPFICHEVMGPDAMILVDDVVVVVIVLI